MQLILLALSLRGAKRRGNLESGLPRYARSDGKEGNEYEISDLYKMNFKTDMSEKEYLRDSNYNNSEDIETAKQNGIAPEDYLSCLFEKAPYAETENDWEKLLPWNIEITPYKIRGEWI